MKVDFNFELDEKVVTMFNEDGIITQLSYDHSGKIYYVQTANCGAWFKEKDITRKIE